MSINSKNGDNTEKNVNHSKLDPKVELTQEEFKKWYKGLLDQLNEKNQNEGWAKEKHELLDIQKGDICIDVGCGFGADVSKIAWATGEKGKVFGVDMNSDMISETQTRINDLSNVELMEADASNLPFDDNMFDKLHSERVTQYIPDTEVLFKEFFRVLKPGGTLVVVDSDWDIATIYHPDIKTTREMIHALTDSFPNGQVGRKMYAAAAGAGFNIECTRTIGMTHSFEFAKILLLDPMQQLAEKGIIDKEKFDSWYNILEELNNEGKFFASLGGIMIKATK